MAIKVRSVAPLDGESVLSLDACKLHLRRFDSDEDDLIEALRDAAIDWVERYTAFSLASRQWVATFDRLMSPLRLPIGPVSAVAGVAYLDSAGVEQTLDTAIWRWADDLLLASPAQVWPAPVDGPNAVSVAFTAGFAPGAVPPGLLTAVRMLLSHFMKNRGAVVIGTTATTLPLGVAALCDQHRMPVLA